MKYRKRLGMGALALVCATAAPGSLSAVASSTDEAEPLTQTPLPVVAEATSQISTGPRFDHVLHGVWRIDGGAIAYWSTRDHPTDAFPRTLTNQSLLLRSGTANVTTPPGFTETSLAVSETGELFSVLIDETTQTCLCTNVMQAGLKDGEAAKVSDGWQLMYAVFPELPSTTETVDVHLDGYGTILPDIPINDEPLPQPQIDADQWIASGQGWPEPPPAEVLAKAAEARTLGAVWELAERSGAADGSWGERASGETIQLDLAADVLFEFDKHAITSKADKVLDDIAKQIGDAQVTKATIVGHTDGKGTEAYNQTLSEKRAASVEKELRKRLPGVTFTVEGRGWHEPIASNKTDEGRALNRRVTITLQGQGQEEGR